MLAFGETAVCGLDLLTTKDFFRDAHQKVFASMSRVVEDGGTIDFVTVRHDLTNHGEIDEIGGPAYLAGLSDGQMRSMNLSQYADIVKEMRRRRDILAMATRLTNRVMDGSVDSQELLATADRELSTLSGQSVGDDDLTDQATAMTQFLDTLDYRIQHKHELLGLTTGWPSVDDVTCGLIPGEMTILAAETGGGKAQPIDALVLTAQHTWKRMDDLQIGDGLASPDGESSRVLGIFPQGPKLVFDVRLSDGRRAEACWDHLWTVRSSQPSWHGQAKTMPTSAVAKLIDTKRFSGRVYIERPIVRAGVLPINGLILDPWLLGVLIGDGCLGGRQIRVSTADSEIRDGIIRAIGSDMALKHLGGCDYRIVTNGGPWRRGVSGVVTNRILTAVRSLGLADCHSYAKFVPAQYLVAPLDARLDLLRGLMDTDGDVSKDGKITFTTTSVRLASDVTSLARSVGCSVWMWTKQPYYTHRGRRHAGKTAYQLRLSHPRGDQLFSLPRKSRRAERKGRLPRFAGLGITSIRPSRIVDCSCIAVSHPRGLYITNDYVVTHNTAAAVNMVATTASQRHPVMMFSLEMSRQQLLYRLAALRANVELFKIRKGWMLPSEIERVSLAMAETAAWPLVIDDNPMVTVRDMRARCRRGTGEKPLALVVVDYIQLVSTTGKSDNRATEVGEIGLGLKRLSRELNVPVLALSQLSRAFAKERRRPRLHDLRESGALEQHADNVWFLWEGQDDVTELIIGKARQGPLGSVDMRFDKGTCHFVDIVAEKRANAEPTQAAF